MSSSFELLLLGLALGARHATDADHVVAVSAIASRERSVQKAVWVGVSWGLGHALSVLFAGGAIVLLGIVIPPRLGLGMELSVGLILVALGISNLTRAPKAHQHDAAQGSSPRGIFRPLGVGIAHGLAGSAAVALLVLASIDEPGSALLYLAVFGSGTLLGMVVLTSVLALPMAYAARRFERVHVELARAAGLLSVAFGLVLVYRIGFVDGLFTSVAYFRPQ